MTFGERLKELRESKGLTQEQISEVINVTRPTIAGYETKGKQPDYDKLKTLADYFNVSVDYLLGHSDTRTPQIKEEPKKFSTKVETIAAHLDDKNLTDDKIDKIKDYIDFLFSKD
ncbi:helix-turn-helix transcriptional regulator [Clostridium sp.]|uniref:helix-turn-helix domain-containing protein n=1 Tax=Clostridium sp. TaxID=1506 RepID=UPI003216526E